MPRLWTTATTTLLGALLAASPRAQSASGSRVAKTTGPPAFFLQDSQTDGHCLGDGVFKRCAIDTLWYVTGKPGAYLLHRRPVDGDDDEDAEEDLCLDRASCDLPESSVRLGHCKHCGARNWNILGDAEQGYALTAEDGKHCLKRVPESNKARTSPCEKKEHAALSLQFATREDIAAMESDGARLVAAAADNDERLVKELIERDGVDANARDWDNLTAVVAAAAGGHKRLVQILVDDFGADVRATDKDDITALMEAAIAGHRDVAEFVLKKAPELLDATAASGVTALWLAAGEGKTKVAELLVKLDADVSNKRSDGITALMAASSGGHAEVAKLLIEGGAEVDAADHEGLTALTNAAENGTAAAVSLLLGAGASVDATSSTGFTPLIVAAAGGHTEACKLLLDAGADVSRTHSEGVDALMYAAAGGHKETAELLIQRGADPKKTHAHGGSALIEAATFGDVGVVELLIKEGADPFLRDDDGVTALMSAASQGKVEATKFLVDLAPPGQQQPVDEYLDAAAHSGGTAMMFAAAGGHLECTKMLLDAGAAVNKRVIGTPEYVKTVAEQIAAGKEDVEPHKDDVTALQVAAQGGHLDVVELLLDVGADPLVADEEGATALTNAVSNDKGDVAFLLVKRGADPNDEYVDAGAKKRNILADAVAAKNDAFASLLVEKGARFADHDAPEDAAAEASSSTKDAKKKAPAPPPDSLFLQAAHRGLAKTVAAMLAMGAEPNRGNAEGVTPLIAAASEGHASVVEALCAAPALQLDAADADGTTALMAAAVRGHLDVVASLVAKGAPVDQQNGDGHTALMFAYNGKAQVQTLLRKYLDVVGTASTKPSKPSRSRPTADGDGDAASADEPDAASTTTTSETHDANLEVINAALAAHAAIVDALVRAGADASIADNQGHTAVDFDYKEPPAASERQAGAGADDDRPAGRRENSFDRASGPAAAGGPRSDL